jgi:restriction endonuclease S subunit
MPLIFGDDKMAVFSIVKLSELEGAKRIDAEYYKPEYLWIKESLFNANTQIFSIKSISNYITNGHTPRYADLTKGDVYFLTAEDVLDFVINFETSKRITKEDSRKVLGRTILAQYDLLITIKGKIGNAAIVDKLDGETNINQDVARVILKKSVNGTKINPYFVAAFINSKFGKSQVEQIATSQINPFLGLGNLKQISIPLLSQKFQDITANIIKKSLFLFYDSKDLYSQAENLLLEELGLKDYKPKYEKTYTAKLSDAFSAHRIDAEYFQPAYEEVIEKIKKKTELKPLGKLAERIKLKHKPEENKIYKYIEISDVSIDIGEVNYTERLGKELPPNARILVKGGELIVSKVRPTRGAIGIIPIESKNNLICSSAFSVFNVDSPLKEYLYIVIRSIIGKLQLEKPTKGTSYPTIEDRDVEKLKIPILPLSTQQKIAELVKQSHESRKKAKELLDVAKRAVEIAIEKDEGEALDYIYKKTAGNSIE